MSKFGSRLQHAWNAFVNRNPTEEYSYDRGPVASYRPDRVRLSVGNERSIIVSLYNRIAIDVSSIAIKHVKVDDNGSFIETVDSGLNEALNVSANADQTGRAFIQDVVMSMFDEGCVAIVPTDTTLNPLITGGYDVQSLRTGKILEWYPSQVRVRVYNERTGIKEDILLPKNMVAIVENPLYAIMNEPNSTLKRLINKLNLLDAIDQQSGSGKLDLIIQLPYVIKSEARKKQAEDRKKDIEDQLQGSKFGIAYIDGTEKITQLNRSAENNLMAQIEYLTKMLYSQLGITESVLDGTADEKTMLNYFNRTIEPVISSIVDEMKRKFITKTARTQKHSIEFFRDPFKLVPVSELADIADKFTRNEILASNEVRAIVGFKPSESPRADELVNKNIAQPPGEVPIEGEEEPDDEGQNGMDMLEEQEKMLNEILDALEADVDKIIGGE